MQHNRNNIKIDDIITTGGKKLLELSSETFVLLVFLRHFGCIFCREALVHISENVEKWRKQDTEVVLVHMSEVELAEKYLAKYNLTNVQSISNPSLSLYRRFGLAKGKINQLLGLKTTMRGFEILKNKGIKPAPYFIGDGFQMPGIFMLKNGLIVDQFIHQKAHDVPDYEKLIHCCRDI